MIVKYGNYTQNPISFNTTQGKVILQPNCANFVEFEEGVLDSFYAIGIRPLPANQQGGIADAKLKSEEVVEEVVQDITEPDEPDVSVQVEIASEDETCEIVEEVGTIDYSAPLTFEQIETEGFDWKKTKGKTLRVFAEENDIDLDGRTNYMQILKIVKNAVL